MPEGVTRRGPDESSILKCADCGYTDHEHCWSGRHNNRCPECGSTDPADAPGYACTDCGAEFANSDDPQHCCEA